MENNQMLIQFLGSYPSVQICPEVQQPEYCFVGRSNVGKSSMINYLTGQAALARISKKPGKTQTINLYRIMENPEWIIADLPGYGYAQVSRSTRGQWSALIDDYLLNRPNLMCTFLLVDLRHPLLMNDRQFMQFLGENQIPFCLLFTKSDKLKPGQIRKAVRAYEEQLLEEWESLPPRIITSSISHTGREEILAYIREMNDTFVRQAL